MIVKQTYNTKINGREVNNRQGDIMKVENQYLKRKSHFKRTSYCQVSRVLE